MKKIICVLFVFLSVCLYGGCSDANEQNFSINPFANLLIEQKYGMLEDQENGYCYDNGIYKASKNTSVKTLV